MGSLQDLRQTALTCRGHTRPVTHLAFSDLTPDGYFLASACKDGKAMLRLGSTGDWIGTLEKHKGAVWCIAINSMATRAATASADHTVKIWDLLNGDELHQIDHKGIVRGVALSRNSNRLLTCGQDRNILLYRLDRLGAAEEFEGPEVGSRHVIFGPTEREIYVASEDGSLNVTDLRAGSTVLVQTYPDVIKDMRFHPDKRSMLLCHGLQADVFDLRAQSTCKTFKLNSGVLTADFHPTEPCLTLGCDDHRLYKFSTYDTENFEVNRGHFGPIHAARYSPDGELIASGSEDGTVRLWQHNVGKTYGLWRGVSNPAFSFINGATSPSVNVRQAYSNSFTESYIPTANAIAENGPYKLSSSSVEEAFCEEDEESGDTSNSLAFDDSAEVASRSQGMGEKSTPVSDDVLSSASSGATKRDEPSSEEVAHVAAGDTGGSGIEILKERDSAANIEAAVTLAPPPVSEKIAKEVPQVPEPAAGDTK